MKNKFDTLVESILTQLNEGSLSASKAKEVIEVNLEKYIQILSLEDQYKLISDLQLKLVARNEKTGRDEEIEYDEDEDDMFVGDRDSSVSGEDFLLALFNALKSVKDETFMELFDKMIEGFEAYIEANFEAFIQPLSVKEQFELLEELGIDKQTDSSDESDESSEQVISTREIEYDEDEDVMYKGSVDNSLSEGVYIDAVLEGLDSAEAVIELFNMMTNKE